MRVRFLHPSDLPELRRMRRSLWPDSQDHEADALLSARPTRYVVLVAERAAPEVPLAGFAEVGIRPYAEDCRSSPVAYLEGIWVDEAARGRGIATALLRAAEVWARARGLTEIASDFDPVNTTSEAFHHAYGFEEANRAVCVRRDVPERGTDDTDMLRSMARPPNDDSVTVGSAAPELIIRPAMVADWDGLWSIFHEVVSLGNTYAYAPDTTREQALATWVDAARATYVAEIGGRVVGTYFIKTNQPGQGSHVCNAGYMVAASARGRGVGEAMCRHSLVEAGRLGYTAMQYNLVVATNTGAIRLWERMGFDVIGRLPGAFRPPDQAPVDALVMYRPLD